MKAMVLTELARLPENRAPLTLAEIPSPEPGERQVLIKVSACGVCHTELDEIEGRTPPSQFPMILGHQVVGRVAKLGPEAKRFAVGDRVGLGWIFSSCEQCEFCAAGNENLCRDFMATGRDAAGGYAEYMAVGEDFAFFIPEAFSDTEAAPLLCAGAIGYRSLRLTQLQDGENLGLLGFGASAHLVMKLVQHLYPRVQVYAFSRTPGERRFALELGAVWAGDFHERPPARLHRAIDTTPVWGPIVHGLRYLERGGRLVINAIRKEDLDKKALLGLDYPEHLWLEKEVKSVANVARRDVGEFLEIAARIPLKPEVQEYRLEDANQALLELKERKIRGAKVLKIT
jgi:propanol-preferring alcohol dehydrogenase